MPNSKKVLMVIASENFRDEEYWQPKEILENQGIEVKTASSQLGERKGVGGSTAVADLILDQASSADFEAIVFIGGPGAVEYFNSPSALNLVKEAEREGKVIGAICIAPSVLANAGILKGKEATAFPSEEENLKQKGANYTGQPVTISGKIITSRGPEAAKEFGQKIAQALVEV